MKNPHNARIVGVTPLYNGNWLIVSRIDWGYEGEDRIHQWETVNRVRTGGAVVVIATLKPSNRIVLVKQFRPPVNRLMLEFPAGLVDSGEAPEAAAIRELKEETGYTGTIEAVWPTTPSSPGLTGEVFHMIEMVIDETLPENIERVTDFDSSEAIETLAVERARLHEFLTTQCEAGIGIDAKLFAFARGLHEGSMK